MKSTATIPSSLQEEQLVNVGHANEHTVVDRSADSICPPKAEATVRGLPDPKTCRSRIAPRLPDSEPPQLDALMP